MRKDVLYFINFDNKTKIVYEHNMEIIYSKYIHVLNKECLLYMSTIEGRIKAMSTYWGSSYNVPIYINENICFLKVDKSLWINVINVEKIADKKILFKNGKVINFEVSKRILKYKVDKIREIIKFIKK